VALAHWGMLRHEKKIIFDVFLYYYRGTVLYLKAKGEKHFKLEPEVS